MKGVSKKIKAIGDMFNIEANRLSKKASIAQIINAELKSKG